MEKQTTRIAILSGAIVVMMVFMSLTTALIHARTQMITQIDQIVPPAEPTASATPTNAPADTAATVPTAVIRQVPEVSTEVVLTTPTPVLSGTTATSDTVPLRSAVPQPAQPPRTGPGGLPYPLRLAELNFGAVGHFYYTDRQKAYSVAREAGFGWIRQQIHWRDIEDRSGEFFWDELDHIVDEANDQGLLVLISVVRSPEWYTDDGSDGKPDNPEDLARFVGALAQHFKGRVHAIEIWNEQNLAHENGGRIMLEEAGQYVELLAASYTAIKAVDPSIIVVAGAPSPTTTNVDTIAVPDIDYMRAMYSYNNGMMRDYFDVQAVHPIGTINPPDKLYPVAPHTAQGWTDNETFYFRHIENMRRVMLEAGLGHHQMWITEFGWATQNNSPGYEYGNSITFEMQRDYIVGAMDRTVREYPWVSNMFVWNLNFTVVQEEAGVDPLHEQGSFSIVNKDWTPRPAYYGIQQFIRDHHADVVFGE